MPKFLNRIFSGASQKETLAVNTYEGFKGRGIAFGKIA